MKHCPLVKVSVHLCVHTHKGHDPANQLHSFDETTYTKDVRKDYKIGHILYRQHANQVIQAIPKNTNG